MGGFVLQKTVSFYMNNFLQKECRNLAVGFRWVCGSLRGNQISLKVVGNNVIFQQERSFKSAWHSIQQVSDS